MWKSEESLLLAGDYKDITLHSDKTYGTKMYIYAAGEILRTSLPPWRSGTALHLYSRPFSPERVFETTCKDR